jgi:two-component system NtrC family sensor kinase
VLALPHSVLLALGGAALLGVGWAIGYLLKRLRRADREVARVTDELNRRLSELFSLQELSYVLSDSLQLERTVDQVVRYALRFLEARGALVALAGEGDADPLRIAAADGSLAALKGAMIERNAPGLVARSLGRERLELVRNSAGGPTQLVGETMAEAAAAVPLRAHGVVVGTLVVVEPRAGAFHPEDIRLLSTVATHAAVVLANARFFEMVRRAKEQWETAFDALSEGMAVVDEAGLVRRANRSLAAMLGRPINDVIGEHLTHALLGQSQPLLALLDATRRGERPTPLVARSTQPGGERTMRITAARMPTPTAEQSLVVLVEDVTEQQAMEGQLIQSEKLAAVGQLVSGVAHELNNPLTSIAGLSEFLLEQKELGPNDRGHLKVIHEQAERAGRIVRNLLTFARKGPTERSHVDLNDVVQRTLLLMSYDLKLKDIEVRKDLASVLPEVLGDRHALQQVVLNLLTNAAQAVAGNETGRPRTIRVRTWFDTQIHLRVADTGPGIPEDAVSQLFTPFFTTKEPGQGTGLGLSISYSIVQAHGGHIVVERAGEGEGGGGAAFRVDLPPAGPEAPASPTGAEEQGPAPEVPAGRRRILLVDDDPAVRRMVQALFGREGHTVDVARNAQHALELAGGRTYDLVIADARAAARGKLFVEELLARNAGLKDRILVATGDVRPATEVTLGRLGLRYVRKPFNLRDLRDEAARVWAATTLS